MAKKLTFYRNGEYIYYSYHAGSRVSGSTGVKLDENGNISDAQQDALDELRIEVNKFVALNSLAKKKIDATSIKGFIDSHLGRSKKVERETLSMMYERFLKDAKTGEVYNKSGNVFSDSTISGLESVQKRVNKDSISSIPVEEMTDKDIKGFTQRLTRSKNRNSKMDGLSKNTVSTYNNLLITVLSATFKLGWHTNKSITEDLYFAGEEIDYPIYYTIDELTKLYRHEFTSKFDEELRDVFLFGCFTCLRHSDYYKTDYRKAIIDDVLVIKLKKRSNQIELPLHPIALEILKKYDYVLPRIYMALFNPKIKLVCKKAGFYQQSLFSRTQKGKLIQEYKHKWELTSSHTMRRSFATNARKLKIEKWAVMELGGWKSESSFRKYERMSKQDVKEDALSSEFYKVRL